MSSRRRSRQKSRQKGRVGRILAVSVGVVLLLLVVGVLGGYLWLTRYLGSEKFRLLVNERASDAIGAEVTVSRFDWDGMMVNSPLIEVRGEDLVQSVDIEGLEAEVKLSSLIRRRVRSSPVHIDRLTLDFEATKDPPSFSVPSGEVEFPGISVDDSSGRVSFGGPLLTWQGTRVDVTSSGGRGSYEFLCRGGRVETPVALFPAGKLREMKARYSGRRLYITRAEFGVYESGRLNLTGEVGFETGGYSFEGQLRDVYGREMVPEDWKKRMEGTFSSDFTVRGRGKSAPVAEGSLTLLDGVLTGLPVFDRIAAYADTTRFRRLVLSEAQLDYSHEGKRLELRNIVLASEGLMRIEGRLDVVERNLNGSFRLGLTPGTLARIPGAETRVFHPGAEGLLWTDIHITGTLDDPEEDLSRRLILAAGARMFELIPETGEQVLRYTESKASEMARLILGSAPEDPDGEATVVEQGVGVIRTGADLVTDGVGSALNLIPGFGAPKVPELIPEEEKLEEEIQKEEEEAPTSSSP